MPSQTKLSKICDQRSLKQFELRKLIIEKFPGKIVIGADRLSKIYKGRKTTARITDYQQISAALEVPVSEIIEDLNLDDLKNRI